MRLIAIFVIALALSLGAGTADLAQAGKDSPAPGSPLSKCTSQPSGPNVVILHCGATELKIMRSKTIDLDGLLSQPAFKEWKREKIVLGGTTLPGAALRAHPTRFGLLVGASQGTEPRLLTCFVDRTVPKGEEACRVLLTALVADGGLVGINFAGNALKVGGRDLVVPPGCQRTAADRIRCARAELHWRDPDTSCKAEREAGAKEALLEMFRRMGSVTQRTQPCTAMGRRLVCDRYLVQPEGQPPVTILGSFPGCAGPMVQCNFLTPPGQQFPEPCDQVFSGKP